MVSISERRVLLFLINLPALIERRIDLRGAPGCQVSGCFAGSISPASGVGAKPQPGAADECMYFLPARFSYYWGPFFSIYAVYSVVADDRRILAVGHRYFSTPLRALTPAYALLFMLSSFIGSKMLIGSGNHPVIIDTTQYPTASRSYHP
jgi:hypothetical protein